MVIIFGFSTSKYINWNKKKHLNSIGTQTEKIRVQFMHQNFDQKSVKILIKNVYAFFLLCMGRLMHACVKKSTREMLVTLYKSVLSYYGFCMSETRDHDYQ